MKLVVATLLLFLVDCSGQSNYEVTQNFYRDRTVNDLPWNAQAPNMTYPNDPFASAESVLLELMPKLGAEAEAGEGISYKRCSDKPITRSDMTGMNICGRDPYTTGCNSTRTPPFYKCVCDEDKACKYCNVSSTPCSPLDQYCNVEHTSVCTPSGSCDQPTCSCKSGYDTDWNDVRSGNAKQCEHDIDECATNPCLHGGTCHNKPGDFYCDCIGHYTGKNCDIKAGCDQGVPCAKAAICKKFTAYDGGKQYAYYRCVCKYNYQGNPYVSCSQTQLATARIVTDPHVKTFDSSRYRDYMGTCPVTFVRLCNPIPHIPDFKVVSRASLDCDPNAVGHVSCIRNLYLEVFNHTIVFTTLNDPTIVVDSGMENLPYGEIPGLTITQKTISTGYEFTATTNFSFNLVFSTDNPHKWSSATVQLAQAQSLTGKICGMAGSMTGVPNNNMVFPNGTKTDDDKYRDDWGDSWSYENLHNPKYDSFGCLFGHEVQDDPDAYIHDKWAASSTPCSVLNDPNGVFAECFGLVDDETVGMAYKKCTSDTGATLYNQRNNQSLVRNAICKAHLVQFAEICRTLLVQEGKKDFQWRAAVGCPTPHCTKNSYFDDMAPDCDNTCLDPHAGDSCVSTKLEERCYCNKGFVLSGGACIPLSECPEYHEGVTYLARRDKTNLPCTTNCVFLHGDDGEVNKGLFCKQVYCAEHGRCAAINGVRDCVCEPGYIGDGRHECKVPQRDCVDLQNFHGVATTGISPVNVWAYLNMTRRVYCDMETDGGGWTVVQRRVDTTDFNRTWQDYIKGFGSLEQDGSFWYGLEMMHKMTQEQNMSVLRIELEYCDGTSVYQQYHGFEIGPAESNYVMTYQSTSGTAGDAFASDDPVDNDPNGVEFSAWDNDHDALSGMNCAMMYDSGWWHRSCTAANLNGKFYENCGGGTDVQAAVWLPKVESSASCPKKITMKIRRPHMPL